MDLGDNETKGWEPEEGWDEVALQVDNMMEYMPRMGYLFSDGVFDLERVAAKKQKFIVKGEEIRRPNKPMESKYREFKFCMRVSDEWLGVGEGFEDVEMTEQIMADLELVPQFLQEVKMGEKKIMGRC